MAPSKASKTANSSANHRRTEGRALLVGNFCESRAINSRVNRNDADPPKFPKNMAGMFLSLESFFIKVITFSACVKSRPVVASSANKTLGAVTNSKPTDKRLRSPPDNPPPMAEVLGAVSIAEVDTDGYMYALGENEGRKRVAVVVAALIILSPIILC